MRPWLLYWIVFVLAWIGLAFLPLAEELDGTRLPFVYVYAGLEVPGQALLLLPFVLAHFAVAAGIAALAVWIQRRTAR